MQNRLRRFLAQLILTLGASNFLLPFAAEALSSVGPHDQTVGYQTFPGQIVNFDFLVEGVPNNEIAPIADGEPGAYLDYTVDYGDGQIDTGFFPIFPGDIEYRIKDVTSHRSDTIGLTDWGIYFSPSSYPQGHTYDEAGDYNMRVEAHLRSVTGEDLSAFPDFNATVPVKVWANEEAPDFNTLDATYNPYNDKLTISVEYTSNEPEVSVFAQYAGDEQGLRNELLNLLSMEIHTPTLTIGTGAKIPFSSWIELGQEEVGGKYVTQYLLELENASENLGVIDPIALSQPGALEAYYLVSGYEKASGALMRNLILDGDGSNNVKTVEILDVLQVSFNDPELSSLEGEEVPSTTLFVRGPDTTGLGEQSVDLFISSSTAIEGEDFTFNSPFTIFIPEADYTEGVEVPVDLNDYLNVLNDDDKELNETVTLAFQNSTDLVQAEGTLTYTLQSDDSFVAEITQSNDAAEGENAQFTVSLNEMNNSGTDVTLGLTFMPGSAVGGSDPRTADYDNSPIIVTIPNGEQSGNAQIPTFDDASIEPTESFDIQLTQTHELVMPSGDGTDLATITITDNDEAGVIFTTVNSDYRTSEFGDSVEVQVRLAARPSSQIIIPISLNTTTEAEIEGGMTQLLIQPDLWNSPEENVVRITGLDDDFVDGLQDFTLNLDPIQTLDPNFDNLLVGSVDFMNEDNDIPGVVVRALSTQTSETGNGVDLEFALTAKPTDSVTIDLLSSDLTEGVLPFSITIQPEDWNRFSSNQLRVLGVDDSIQDGNQEYTILTGEVRSGDGAFDALSREDVADLTLSNADDESANIILSPTFSETSEEGANLSVFFTLTSQPNPGEAVRIPLILDDTTEASISTNEIVLDESNWNSPNNELVITGLDDTLVDGDVIYHLLTGDVESNNPDYAVLTADNVEDLAFINIDNDVDTDGDQVSDEQEALEGTDPNDATDYQDTDGDFVPDFTETNEDGTNPEDASDYTDTDEDGHSDYTEEEAGSDPADATSTPEDTDGDGTPDFTEELDGTNPEDSSDYQDSDGDGDGDYTEDFGGGDSTDPEVGPTDTDGDQVPDLTEGNQGTDPEDGSDYQDVDGDFVPDYTENTQDGTDPINPEDAADTDGDGHTDYAEDLSGSDPTDAASLPEDSDNDGTPDGVEETQGTDPSNGSDYQDTDGDGDGDYTEDFGGGDSTDPATGPTDTDGDTVPDFTEENQGTDPSDPESYQDQDGNGIPDYTEATAGIDSPLLIEFTETGGVSDEDGELALPSLTVSGLDTTGLGEITVEIDFDYASATEDVDYSFTGPVTVVIPEGDYTTPTSILVEGFAGALTVFEDQSVEYDEAVAFALRGASTFSQIGDADADGEEEDNYIHTINNDDFFTASITDITDGSEEDGFASFVVTLNEQNYTGEILEVAIQYTDLEAIGGVDATSADYSNEILIAEIFPSAEMTTVEIPVFDDFFVENLEDFSVQLVQEEEWVIPSEESTATLEISSNDVAGITVFGGSDFETDEFGDTASVSFALTAQPTQAVTIPVSVSNDEASLGEITTITITPENWNQSQNNTLTLTGADDNLVDGSQSYSLEFGLSTSEDTFFNGLETGYFLNDVFGFTNADNDLADVFMTALTTETSEDGASATLQFTLGAEPTAEVILSIFSTDITEGVAPLSITIQPENWNNAEANTIEVTGVDDSLEDGAQTYEVFVSEITSEDGAFDVLTGEEVERISLTNLDNLEEDNSGTGSGGGGGPSGGSSNNSNSSFPGFGGEPDQGVDVASEDDVFSDVNPEDAYYDAVNDLYDLGVVQGYEDGTFRPENVTNRAEFLAFIINSLGVTQDLSGYKNCFPDVTNQWYASYVCYAEAQDWVTGYSDGLFRPEQTVNKVESIRMVVSAFGFSKTEEMEEGMFLDLEDGSWYELFVNVAYHFGLIDLPEDKMLFPASGMTRGELAEMLVKALAMKAS